MFIPTYQVDEKVVDKLDFLWTKEEKRRYEIDFKKIIFIIAKPPRKCGILLK